MLEQILGQEKVRLLLISAFRHNKLPHAYLFHGPDGSGKFTAALQFAMMLNCDSVSDKTPCGECSSCRKMLDFNHPGFIYIFPTPKVKTKESGELKTESINDYQDYIENRKNTPWLKKYFSTNCEIRKESIELLQSKLEFSQREGRYRVCVIEDADEMNNSTANSLLKTLEEPPSNTILILLTTRFQSLLPTIISRCQTIMFSPLQSRIIEDYLITKLFTDKQDAKTFSRLSNGNMGQAIRLSQDQKQDSRVIASQLLRISKAQDDIALINLINSQRDLLKAELTNEILHHIMHDVSDAVSYIANKDDSKLAVMFSIKDPATINNLNWLDAYQDFTTYIDSLHTKVDGNANCQIVIVNLYNKLKSLLNQNHV